MHRSIAASGSHLVASRFLEGWTLNNSTQVATMLQSLVNTLAACVTALS